MAVLTVSGNEITDALRATNAQGDGLSADSSFGMWPAATNNVLNGGFETNTTGYAAFFNGTANGTFARDTARFKFGAANGKMTFSAGGNGEGVDQFYIAVNGDAGALRLGMTAGNTFTASAWVYVPSGVGAVLSRVLLWVNHRIGAGAYQSVTSTTPTAFDTWQRITMTFTLPAGTTEAFLRLLYNGGQNGVIVHWDGIQLEAGSLATPYVHTDGAAATRAASRVQAPASFVGSQGWVAFRVRPRWASTDSVIPTPVLLDWRTDANNYYQVGYEQANDRWYLTRNVAGTGATVVTASGQSFAAGVAQTVVVAWDTTQLKISVNGGAFVTLADARTLSPASLIDLGQLASAFFFQGEILWTAFGKGTVTDGDASAFHGSGNTDPSVLTLSSGVLRSAMWPAVTSTADDFAQVGKSNVVPYEIGKRFTVTDAITDAMRWAFAQGDERWGDSSYGFWEQTTNIDPNSDAKSTEFGFQGAGGAVARSTAEALYETHSALFTATGGASGGCYSIRSIDGQGHPVTAGLVYTSQCRVMIPVATGHTMRARIEWYNSTGGFISVSDGADVAISTVGKWTRLHIIATAPVGAVTAVPTFYTTTTLSAGTLIYYDGRMLAQQRIPMPVVPTDGASATRNGARARGPVALIDETACSYAFRVRYGWATSAMPGGGTGKRYLLDWRDDANNLIGLYFDEATAKWTVERKSAGAGALAQSAAQTVAVGATATIVLRLSATQARVSVNGTHVSVANSSIPVLAATLFDLGSQAGASQFDGDILWAVSWVRDLSDAEVATVSAFDNSDPLWRLLPGNVTSRWGLNDDSYMTGPPLTHTTMWGVSTHLAQLIGSGQTAAAQAYAKRIQNSGAKIIRDDINWSGVEAVQGTYSWTVLDGLLDICQVYGFKLVAQVGYAPAWASGHAGDDKFAPTAGNISKYGDFVRALVQRAHNNYPGILIAVEYWNEPNIPFFKDPATSVPNAALYTQLAQDAYPKAKAVAPEIELWGGATAPSDTTGGNYDSVDFIEACYTAGISGNFDAWSHHPYYFTVDIAATSLFRTDVKTGWNQAFARSPTIRASMNSHGDTAKILHASEVGIPTHPPGPPTDPKAPESSIETLQVTWFTEFWRDWRSRTGAGHLMVYTGEDSNTFDLSSREPHFGIFRSDFSMKGIVFAMQAAPQAAQDIVGRSVTLAYKALAQVGKSSALPYLVRLVVGKSIAQPFSVIPVVGRSLSLVFKVAGAVGRSLVTAFGIAQQAAIPGRTNVDTYSDGAAHVFGIGTPTALDTSIFATLVQAWVPPAESDLWYARLPFEKAQAILGAAGPRTSLHTMCAWHGTSVNEERGSTAVVRAGGVLSALIGQTVKVSTKGRRKRSVVALVIGESDEIYQELSLSRRLFTRLDYLSKDAIEVKVETLG